MTEDTRKILEKLDIIERRLQIAEMRRIMGNDFNLAGHLWPSTVEYIKKAVFADLLGYSDD